MTDAGDLRTRAEAVLNAPVLAAGIFSSEGMIGASIIGAVAGTTVAEAATHIAEDVVSDAVLGTTGSGIADAAGAVVGMHAAREHVAASHGMTPVILVAITADRISLMDWDGDAGSGSGPTRELVGFMRNSTTVTFGKIGVNHTVTLDDGEQHTVFTGALGLLSSGKEGKRSVLKELGDPNL